MEADFEKNVMSLDRRLEDLNREIFRRRFHDSLVMERVMEDVERHLKYKQRRQDYVLGNDQ
jgi:hypothetical protein